MFLKGHHSVSENANCTAGDVLNIYNQQRAHIHCYKSFFFLKKTGKATLKMGAPNEAFHLSVINKYLKGA